MERFAGPFSYALVGLLAGGRTTMALMFASERLRARPAAAPGALVRLFRSDALAHALQAFAVIEMVIDKLPIAGDRTSPAGLIPRALAGGASGAALAAGARRSRAIGGAVGAAAAVAGTFAMFHVRRVLSRRLPPMLAGLTEDVVVAGVARFALRRS